MYLMFSGGACTPLGSGSSHVTTKKKGHSGVMERILTGTVGPGERGKGKGGREGKGERAGEGREGRGREGGREGGQEKGGRKGEGREGREREGGKGKGGKRHDRHCYFTNTICIWSSQS